MMTPPLNTTAGFIGAMRAAGLAITEPERIISNGRICRFHVDGDRHGTRNGWCVLFCNGHSATGAFGCWKRGITGTWHGNDRDASPTDGASLHAAIAAAARQREIAERAKHEAAAALAGAIWSTAKAADPAHAYLKRKLVLPHGVRQAAQPPHGFWMLRGATLLLPAQDACGRIWTLEGIDGNGTKQFMPGGRKAGHFYVVGSTVSPEAILIAEGFSTAAALNEATSYPVVVAFDCGNLERVARAVRHVSPRTRIVICADNDMHVEGNPGMTHAVVAAHAIHGELAVPPTPFNDFNDVWVANHTPGEDVSCKP